MRVLAALRALARRRARPGALPGLPAPVAAPTSPDHDPVLPGCAWLRWSHIGCLAVSMRAQYRVEGRYYIVEAPGAIGFVVEPPTWAAGFERGVEIVCHIQRSLVAPRWAS